MLEVLLRGRNLIEHEPVQSQLSGRFQKLTKFNRFANVAVGAQVIALDHVLFFARGSEDNDWQPLGALIGSYPAQDFKAINFRQFQVQQNQLRHGGRISSTMAIAAEKIIERLNSIVRYDNIINDVALLERAQC